MKISFSTLGCPKLTFDEIIATATDLGYNGIEMRGVAKTIDAPNLPQFNKEKITATKERLARLNLEIPILTSACCICDKWEEEGKEMALRYVETAKSLGTPYVRILADLKPEPRGELDEAKIKQELKALADQSGEVMLLIETNGIFADSARLAKLIEDIDNIGVIWDINHPFRYFSESPQKTFSNLKGRIKHVHLKDSNIENGEVKYHMMGHGDLPSRECVELLLADGYDGYFSFEWVKRWDVTLEEPGIAFAQYASFMRNLV